MMPKYQFVEQPLLTQRGSALRWLDMLELKMKFQRSAEEFPIVMIYNKDAQPVPEVKRGCLP